MSRAALLALMLLIAGPAAAADRVPVAVVWMGEGASLQSGGRASAEQVHATLSHSPTARPLDSVDDRRALIEGGPASQASALIDRAQASFARLKYADAARDYEAAEVLLLSEVPVSVERQRLGEVERGLLACYDQLGRAGDAVRAAARVTWAAGSTEDVKALLDRHPRKATVPSGKVMVTTDPAGAEVQRDLLPAGNAPTEIAAGDPSIDVIDVDAPGYRRFHQTLDNSEIKVALVREDRLAVMVDHIRAQAPDAPPAEVAALGRRVGAARVLALLPDGSGNLHARWLDVASAKWGASAIRVANSGAPAMEELVRYVAPAELHAPGEATASLAPNATVPKPEKKSAWGRWYTWAAAGAVVALVAGLLIAEHVGDDQVKVTASH